MPHPASALRLTLPLALLALLSFVPPATLWKSGQAGGGPCLAGHGAEGVAAAADGGGVVAIAASSLATTGCSSCIDRGNAIDPVGLA